MSARDAGSRYGMGRSTTAFTTLKMAVLAPMPSASVRMATAAKPGERQSTRRPHRTSCASSSMARWTQITKSPNHQITRSGGP